MNQCGFFKKQINCLRDSAGLEIPENHLKGFQFIYEMGT